MVDIELGLNSQASTAVASLVEKLLTERKYKILENILNLKHIERKFHTQDNYESYIRRLTGPANKNM